MINKSLFFSLMMIVSLVSCQKEESIMEENNIYNGHDLGLTQLENGNYSIKVWSPKAEKMVLNFYEADLGGDIIHSEELKNDNNGIWTSNIDKKYEDKYFAVKTTVNGTEKKEVPEPYAKMVGTNGERQLLNIPSKTAPKGWANDKYVKLESQTDAIIYELHVRDLSIHPESGIKHKGKFIGLIEKGTKTESGVMTGFDYIKSLGITHIHLLPSFDHRSIDETKLDVPQFNWGYDPLNYNSVEGSYSTNPADAKQRILEFKQLVQAFHNEGIGVILDVVYNHTGLTKDSYLEQIAPGEYYRFREDGSFSDASACGNETASERPMIRKFITESVAYWTKEFHLDGFRFDLMAIHDIETMNEVAKTVRAINPSALIYGEGWTAGDSPLPYEKRALKDHAAQMDNIAVFSDDIRDGLKGYVFDHHARGFVSGLDTVQTIIKFGTVASVEHPQIQLTNDVYAKKFYAANPQQTVSYVSCHDNNTLWDRLVLSMPNATEKEKEQMHKLALASVLTSQGVAFLHAGSEMCRTKDGEHNSYNLPDEINQFDYQRTKDKAHIVEYVKGLIALRKANPAFRLRTAAEIKNCINFEEVSSPNVVAYTIDNIEKQKNIKFYVAMNGDDKNQNIQLPDGEWKVLVDSEKVNLKGIKDVQNKISLEKQSILVAIQKK